MHFCYLTNELPQNLVQATWVGMGVFKVIVRIVQERAQVSVIECTLCEPGEICK